ncbi:hypothetical protein WJX73_010770 [Symbiochloris irregularis]|uniref:DNA polymerase V n=1 Tax=Symbiochloris irregularis TaxID=706552 RepID=A0AAW1NWW7_9CHLO
MEAAQVPEPGEEPAAPSTSAGEQILSFFWDLAEVDQAVRLKAADGLCDHLCADQKGFEEKHQSAQDSRDPALTAPASLPGCAASVDYALKRLVRGLESSRKAARQGFAMGLTMALQQISAIPTTNALDSLDSALPLSNNAKGSDSRNAILGRLFGYAAFGRAHRLQDINILRRCVEAVVVCMSGKFYLREAGARVLILLLEDLSAGKLGEVLQKCSGLHAMLTAPLDASFPEALWLALHLWPKLPATTVLNDKNEEAAQQPDPAQLAAFWGEVIEGQLFASSHERQALGLQIFSMLLPHLGPQHVAAVFSPNFLHCLSTNLSHQDSHLHKLVHQSIQGLGDFLDASPDKALRVAVVVALQRHAGVGFTSTKFTGRLLKGLDREGIDLYLQQLPHTFPQEVSAATRQLCTSRLITVVGGLIKQSATAKRVLAGKRAKAANKLINSKKRRKRADGQAAEAGSEEEDAQPQEQLHDNQFVPDGDAALAAVLDTLQRAGSNADKALHLVDTIPPEVAGAAATLRDLATSLPGPQTGETSQGQPPQRIAALHRLVQLLQLYFLADPASAETALAADLSSIWADMNTSPGEGAGDQGAPWMDRLLDVMLSLLARAGGDVPFTPLRDTVNLLFRHCCPMVTATGLQDILRVIAQPLDPRQKDPDEEEQEEEQEEAEGEDEEEGSEGAVVVEGEDTSSDSSEEDESDEDESAQSSGSEDETAEPSAATEGATTTGAAGSDEEEDPDFTDAQMFGMDAALSAALKAATEGKSQASRKSMREALVDFKFRVLDLLEAYAKHHPGSALLPSLIPPLLRSLRTLGAPGGHEQLANTLLKVIEAKISRAKVTKKTGPGQAPPAEELATLLDATWRLAARARDAKVAAASTAAFSYLLRVALGASDGTDAYKAVAEKAWGDALGDLLEATTSHLPPNMLTEAARRFPHLGVAHWGRLTGLCATIPSEFRKHQALELVQLLLCMPQEKGKPLQIAPADADLTAALAAVINGAFQHPKRHYHALRVVHKCLRSLQPLNRHKKLDLNIIKAALLQASEDPAARRIAVQLQYIAGEVGESSIANGPLKWSGRKKEAKEAKRAARLAFKEKNTRLKVKEGGVSKRKKKEKAKKAKKHRRAQKLIKKGGAARKAALKANVKAKVTE